MLTDPAFRDSLGTHISEYFRLNEGTASSTIAEWEAFKVVTRGFCIGKTIGIRKELERELNNVEGHLRSIEKEEEQGKVRKN